MKYKIIKNYALITMFSINNRKNSKTCYSETMEYYQIIEYIRYKAIAFMAQKEEKPVRSLIF